MNDEFFIGWEAKMPAGIGRRIRHALLALFALAAGLALLFATAQQTIGVSVFEWGKVKEFSGVFQSRPYPHLLVPRPGAGEGQTPFSSYYLVNPFKFGLDAGLAASLHGKAVRLKGTLIYRGNQTMIEVLANSIRQQDTAEASLTTAQALAPVNLGRQTLLGEIVDSKCYLGVMNPGNLIPHRACAIRCISGGIPPVLLVRPTNGPALYFLLVSPEGHPVNKQVLPLVAEPVEITGEVQRQGDLLILRAEPETYRRLRR